MIELYILIKKKSINNIFSEIQNAYPKSALHTETEASVIKSGNEIRIIDPDVYKKNPADRKAHKVARGKLSHVDKDLKPNLNDKSLLLTIINSPKFKSDMTDEEQLLVWKYRYFLMDYKKGLIKFLYCIDWSDEFESSEAITLLKDWSSISADDALVLLTEEFKNPEVRTYAIDIISQYKYYYYY